MTSQHLASLGISCYMTKPLSIESYEDKQIKCYCIFPSISVRINQYSEIVSSN